VGQWRAKSIGQDRGFTVIAMGISTLRPTLL
jgi:hypothetical protein